MRPQRELCRHARLLVSLATVAWATAAVGCGPSRDSHGACLPGEVVIGGNCTQVCSRDADCGHGGVCSDRQLCVSDNGRLTPDPDPAGSGNKPEGRAGKTLFVSFRGVTLQNGPWDAVNSSAEMPLWSCTDVAEFPPYSDPCTTDTDCAYGTCSYETQREDGTTVRRCSEPDTGFETMVLLHLRGMLQDFDVEVVRNRPETGAYHMGIVSISEACQSRHTALNPTRGCGPTDVNRIFFVLGNRAPLPPMNAAKFLAQYYSFSLGLTRSLADADAEGRCDIMSASCQGAYLHFADTCLPAEMAYYDCPDEQTVHCPWGEQNSYRYLLEALGPKP